MSRIILIATNAMLLAGLVPAGTWAQDIAPFVGRWAFRLPDKNPAWLRVEADGTAQLLWSVGSAKPVKEVSVDGSGIHLYRPITWRPYGGKTVCRITEPMIGRIDAGGRLGLSVSQTCNADKQSFHMKGKRMPPLPPAPKLMQVKFGPPIDLLRHGLADWELTNSQKINGWRFADGQLINETPKKDFGAYGQYGNLRTKQEFRDFELTIEYNVAAGGNSGIYLRGAYEVQVVDRDSRMQGIQGPGAVFGRIAPTRNTAVPGGQWNRYRILLVQQHITVELNGHRVIDNQPLEGCTGGGINADDTIPGPIFLQGDHTSVRYRHIVIRPVSH